MADAKISELTAYTSPIDTDEFAVVDKTAGITKKIVKSDITANTTNIKFNTDPTVGDFAEGKLFYDKLWKTLGLNIDTDITLQIGQETVAYCKNVTGSAIPNGSVVYITGADGGYPTIDLADATDVNKSFVLGVVTKLAGIDATTGMGHVTIRGHVNDLNTDAWTVGTSLYLSATPGAMTSTAPSAGSYDVRVGRVMIKHASTGRVYVNIRPMMNLTDLGDVTLASPAVDQVLKYNGAEWINGDGVTVSSSIGIDFFNDDATILAATPTNTNNANVVETLLKTPRTAAEQAEVVESVTTTVTPKFLEGYLYNVNLDRVKLDAGTWEFDTYCSANSTNSSPQIDRNIYQVISGTGTLSTVRTSTTIAVTQTATTGIFSSGDATADITTCGYLQTPQGLFEITGYTSTKIIAAKCLATYTDETDIAAGSWRLWRKLFGINTGNITFTNTNYGLISTKSVQPEFTLTADGTDRLASIVFGRSSNTGRIIYFVHNGAVRASHLSTPLITLHNNLAGLQGGSSTERYHLTSAEKTVATQAATSSLNGYATSTQITKLDGIATGANAYVHPNHTGEVTSVADGATTIAANAVTLAKLATQAANTVLANATTGAAVPTAVTVAEQTLVGRITGGNVDDLSTTQARTLLNVADGATNNTKATGAEIDTGTDDAKFATSKALADSTTIAKNLPPTDLKISTASKGGIFNGGFELAPAFTAVQTASNYIDGTAAGSATPLYGWNLYRTATAIAVSFDSTVSHSGKYSLKLSTTDTTGRCYVSFGPPTTAGGLLNNVSVKPSTIYRISGWVKTNNVAADSAYIQTNDTDSSGTNGTTTASSKLTGTNDWTFITYLHTTANDAAYMGLTLLNNVAGNVSDAWFDDITIEEVVTDTTFTGKVAEKIRPVLQAVTSTDNIDNSLDSGGAYANTYALTNAVNEGATHIQTFTPTKKYTTQIGVWVVEAGTGVDWTLTVHTAANVVVASKLIAAASLVEGAFNYFDVPNIWTSGALHFHLYASATTGTPTCKANTSNDLETASYIQRYAKKSEGFTLISNGIKTELKADKDGLLTGAVVDLDNGKYRYDTGVMKSAAAATLAFCNDVFSADAGNATPHQNGINLWQLDNSLGLYADSKGKKLTIKVNTILPIKHLKLKRVGYTSAVGGEYISDYQVSTDNVSWTTFSCISPASVAETTQYFESDILNGNSVFYLKLNTPSDANNNVLITTIGIEADLDTSSIPSGLLYPIATNQFTETVKLPSTVDRVYFQSAKYTNEYGVVVPALEFCSTAVPVGYTPLKLDNTQETSPCVRILSTTTNYQASGTGSDSSGYILNTGEYLTLTSAVAELKVDYQVGTGTTSFANITKNTLYLSSNAESSDSTQDPSHQANFIVGVRQQGLTDRVKDLGDEIAQVRGNMSRSLTLKDSNGVYWDLSIDTTGALVTTSK